MKTCDESMDTASSSDDDVGATASAKNKDRGNDKNTPAHDNGTSSSSPTSSNANCPSCNTPNAIFSKNQSKKKHRDRKCKLCIEKMLLAKSMLSPMDEKKGGKKRKKRGNNDVISKNAMENGEEGGEIVSASAEAGALDDDGLKEDDGHHEDGGRKAKKAKYSHDEKGDLEEDTLNPSKEVRVDAGNGTVKDTPDTDKLGSGQNEHGDKKKCDTLEKDGKLLPVEKEAESDAGKRSSMQSDIVEENGLDDDDLEDTPVGKKCRSSSFGNTDNRSSDDDSSKKDDQSDHELEDSPVGKNRSTNAGKAGMKSKLQHDNNASSEDDICKNDNQSDHELEDTPVGKSKTMGNNKRKTTISSEHSDEELDSQSNIGDDHAAAGGWSPMQSEDEEQDGLEDTPAGKRNGSEDKPKSKSVRERMAMARNNAFGSNGSDEESDANNMTDDEAEKGLSVEELKHKILGRSVSSMYDICESSEAAQSSNINKLVIDASSAFTDGGSVSNHLRQDLTCPICHDRLYNPASLMCGHSFCLACLTWWLDKKQQQRQDVVHSDDEENDATKNGGTCPSCREPIPMTSTTGNNNDVCRPAIKVNMALKAVLDTLYGAEMNQRRLTEEREKLKARGGEMGGMHSRGCEEIVPLAEEQDELEYLRTTSMNSKKRNGGGGHYKDEEAGWLPLYSAANQPGWQSGRSGYNRGAGSKIMIRRNIVLDDCDQRFQLSMGLTKCTYSGGSNTALGRVLDVELCILAMEEDEVDDSGFPIFINEGGDDEALISASNDRIHTCIESSVRVIPASALLEDAQKKRGGWDNVFGRARDAVSSGNQGGVMVQEVTLSRGMIGRDGSVRFRIDLKKALENAVVADEDDEGGADDANGKGRSSDSSSLEIVKLRFCHVDTGSVLELRLPSKSDESNDDFDDGDAEIEFCGTSKPSAARNDGSRYLLDGHDDDEEDHHEPNQYQEDEFLVNGTQDSEEEGEFDSHDEEHDDEDGVCQVCGNGGDLIVCDGGDHEGGCGKAYHVNCIGRSVVPPGDWICEACANSVGLNVGIEGHEWEEEGDGDGENKISDEDENEAKKNEPLVMDDSDDSEDDIAPIQKNKKNANRKVFDLADSDDSS